MISYDFACAIRCIASVSKRGIKTNITVKFSLKNYKNYLFHS